MSVSTDQLLIVLSSVLILLVVMSAIVMMATEQLLLMLHSVKVRIRKQSNIAYEVVIHHCRYQ